MAFISNHSSDRSTDGERSSVGLWVGEEGKERKGRGGRRGRGGRTVGNMILRDQGVQKLWAWGWGDNRSLGELGAAGGDSIYGPILTHFFQAPPQGLRPGWSQWGLSFPHWEMSAAM